MEHGTVTTIWTSKDEFAQIGALKSSDGVGQGVCEKERLML